MRYWVYINEKVTGPYEEDALADVKGFTPDTLICAEDVGPNGNQEWVKASSLFEFGDSQKTSTTGMYADNKNTATSTGRVVNAADAQANQILLNKIDQLTLEIKSMKTKLEEAVAAANAAQKAAEQRIEALNRNIPREDVLPETPSNDDALVTNTESLLNHADQLIAQANEQEKHPESDGAAPQTAEKSGEEEAVLRSALDSLYNASLPTQTEEEKDTTFQDLLSPFKTAAVGAAVGAAATVAASQLSDSKEKTEESNSQEVEPVEEPVAEQPAESPEETEQKEPVVEEALSEQKTEPVEEQPEPAPEPIAEPTPEPELTPEPVAEPVQEQVELTEEKKEEFINQFSSPVQPQGQDFIAQALAEVERQKQQEAAQKDQKDPFQSNQQPAPFADSDAPSLDLDEQPQLNIAQSDEETTPSSEQEQPKPFDVPQMPTDPQLQAMNPDDELKPEDQEYTKQTIKELVPGKKLEAEQESDGLISQEDLDEAFEEHSVEPDVPTSETSETAENKDNGAFYQPKDMTEVQLDKGSTYLISDFIPPADMNQDKSESASADKSSNGKQASKQNEATASIVEMVPSAASAVAPTIQTTDAFTISKISLENTIKAKRGATMDIKTVPMVQEPSDSNRLDLTESGLDMNAQHDLQVADYPTGGSKITKLVISVLVSIVFIGLIYLMLAYLELMPNQLNVLKSKQNVAADVQNNSINEMLPSDEDMQQESVDGEDAESAISEENELLLTQVKNYALTNGDTLESFINSRYPEQADMIEWSLTTAVEPDNYSVLIKIPPENPQSFKISYRFNYNAVTNELEPTTSDSKNLLDSVAQ